MGAGGRSLPETPTCVFRTIVTDRFGSVTAEFGNVTGHFGDVTDGLFAPG
jgi:hypothetical protein